MNKFLSIGLLFCSCTATPSDPSIQMQVIDKTSRKIDENRHLHELEWMFDSTRDMTLADTVVAGAGLFLDEQNKELFKAWVVGSRMPGYMHYLYFIKNQLIKVEIRIQYEPDSPPTTKYYFENGKLLNSPSTLSVDSIENYYRMLTQVCVNMAISSFDPRNVVTETPPTVDTVGYPGK